METPLEALNRMRAEQVIRSLKARNMPGFFAQDKAEAISVVNRIIPAGSVVGFGGSMTIQETGLLDALRAGNFRLLDRYKSDLSNKEMADLRLKALTCDVLLTSANAITLSGKIVCVDGAGSRVAPIMFGPKKVIVVAGINKIVTDLPQAFDRIRTIAGPANCIRLSAKTPCAQDGICQDEACAPPERLCNAFIILEGQRQKDRVNVVLIGEEFGF